MRTDFTLVFTSMFQSESTRVRRIEGLDGRPLPTHSRVYDSGKNGSVSGCTDCLRLDIELIQLFTGALNINRVN